MHNALSDLRYALRGLRRTPLVVVVTVVSLAIGIGATTSVFSIVNAFMFRPATGLGEPETLITIYASRSDGEPFGALSYPDYEAMCEAVEALAGVAAFGFDAMSLGDGSGSEVLLTQVVSGNYFEVLDIRPVLGRTFLPDETVVGSAERVVIIGHRLWQERFAGDPAVLGQSIRLNGHPFTVVGVAPRGLGSRMVALTPEAWIPIGVPGASPRRSLAELSRRDLDNYRVMGRLTGGVTLAQVQAQLEVLASRLHEQYPEQWTDDNDRARALTALSEKDSRMTPNARSALAVVASFLLGAALLVLLIACSNVASLFLARGDERRREMAVRATLGASRARLVVMLLVDAVIPGLLGGAGGVALAVVATRALSSISLPAGLPPLRFDFALDHRVLAFALVVSLGATIAFGLAPALQGSRPQLVPALRGLAAGGGRRRRHLGWRNLLVIAQVAGSVILIAGAGLFLRSIQGAAEMDLGLTAERVAVTSKELPPERYPAEVGLDYVRDLLARLAAYPEVESAAVSRRVELTLLAAFGAESELRAAGAGGDAEAPITAHRNPVTPGYLEMLEVPILGGRTFDAGDVPGAPPVAVVNQTLARRLWPGQDPLGQRFSLIEQDRAADRHDSPQQQRSFEVIGIARDGKYLDIDEDPTPYLWTSLWQDYPAKVPVIAVLVKGRSSAEAAVGILDREVEVASDELAFAPPTPLARLLDLQRLHLRAAARVLGVGGSFGLVLALVGIYGIVSFALARRRHEIAIRMAIGAVRCQVVGLVVRDGMVLVAIGMAAGLAVVLPVAHLVRSQLFGITPLDPVALGGSVALILLAALLASLIPARQALKIAPMQTLREE